MARCTMQIRLLPRFLFLILTSGVEQYADRAVAARIHVAQRVLWWSTAATLFLLRLLDAGW